MGPRIPFSLGFSEGYAICYILHCAIGVLFCYGMCFACKYTPMTDISKFISQLLTYYCVFPIQKYLTDANCQLYSTLKISYC